jgi:hypothetical protein
MGGFAGAEGCYQIPQDAGALVYWTNETYIDDPLWRSRLCASTLDAVVADAPRCGLPDAAGWE